MVVQPLGDCAFTVSWGEMASAASGRAALVAAERLRRAPFSGQTDVVAAYSSLALYFRCDAVPSQVEVEQRLSAERSAPEKPDALEPTPMVEIPVVYGGESGPDLREVCAHTGLSEIEVIRRHSEGEYHVQAIGFLPGFPYLAGLPPELACPRRPSPRSLVPAGSVGIGGAQTGVYPCASPGGWNLIGRTPLGLFDPSIQQPALLKAGDRVRFVPVSRAGLQKAPEGNDSPSGNPGIRILRPGMLCSVQDLGRVGWRSIGVGTGGSTDEMAARIANLLVGNPENAAGLEFALAGPELRFEHDVWIAIGGGEFAGLASWTPHRVTAGTTLRIGEVLKGCRGFLAVSGGIDVPTTLGGRGAHLRAGFGGGFGRALRAGDALPVGPDDGGAPRGRWRIDPRLLPRYSTDAEVRLIPRDGFAPDGGKAGWFKVSLKSDRMGLRLEEPLPLGEGAANLASAPVAPGVVQVPPDGRPIVLLADAQTIGGYPQLGQVATVDLPVVAQLRPGGRMRFRMITLAEARDRLAARERGLALLREGLKERRA